MSEPRPDLPPAAQRALAEAEERRRAAEAEAAANPRPAEYGGRDGLDPARRDRLQQDIRTEAQALGLEAEKGLAIDF